MKCPYCESEQFTAMPNKFLPNTHYCNNCFCCFVPASEEYWNYNEDWDCSDEVMLEAKISVLVTSLARKGLQLTLTSEYNNNGIVTYLAEFGEEYIGERAYTIKKAIRSAAKVYYR